MRNNTQHSVIKNYVKQPTFYAACFIALLSSTSIASAQDRLTTPEFPAVPQLSPSSTTLPVLGVLKTDVTAAQPPLKTEENVTAAANDEVTAVTASNTQATPATIKPVASYGTWPKSLMFPEQEIQYMKTILDEYEATGEVPLSLQDIPEFVEVIEEPTVDITEYPSFHLKSILYHSPKYWGIWVNDIKVTSRDNNSGDAEIKIVNISKDIVRFEWKPADPAFMKAFTRQLADLKEVADDTVLPIINRTTRSARSAKVSEDQTALYFSLRLNESFSTETFYTFDGKPASLSYPSLDIPYSIDNKIAPATAQIAPDVSGTEAPANLDETLATIEASKAAKLNDNTSGIHDAQSPKELIDSMAPSTSLDSLTPEQALKVIESITK